MKRSATLQVLSTLLVVMLAIMAVACAGGEPTPPPPPTATPIPPTPVPEEGRLVFEYAEYADPSGVFCIEYPADWTADDRSRPDTAFVSWYPEEPYATVSVFLTFVTGVPDPQAQIHALIDEWMVDASAFATDPDYQELSREVQDDGSVLLRFYYTREGEPTEAGCFFEVRDSLFSALCFAVAEERWDELVDDFNYMANSYVITPPVAEGPPSGYAEYMHSSGVFSIEYPEDWQISDTSAGENIVVTFSPPEGGVFVVPALLDVGITFDEDTMNTFIESFLNAGFAANPDYQGLGRDVQANGGLLVSFSYTQGDETVQAGTFFEQKDTIVSALTIGPVEDQWGGLLDTFDHMVKTYVIDETAWPY